MKANTNGATFRICDKARGAPIQNDVFPWLWFALGRNATPFFNMFNAPCRRELTRADFVQSARRPAQKSQKVQIANSLSNDNASFARAQYQGVKAKEKNQ
ncbi:hypothetical protein [Primorskyibacter sp. S187A]|uniref:hypothetical protein n=1 Tax=Primorskyibacter sp. S187A TaxID=3415130 RepID=UPI003C7E501D